MVNKVSLYPELDLWATAKPYLEKLAKDKYSFKKTAQKISEQLPELVLELPQIPMLVINALKQIEKGSLNQASSKKQTEAILAQLRENSAKERATNIAIALLALAVFLATQSIWAWGVLSLVLSFLFWLKSR